MSDYTKPCARPGCERTIVAPYRSTLALRVYCSELCCHAARRGRPLAWTRRFDRQDLAVALSALQPIPLASDVVPCPSNNVQHKRIQLEQLLLIREYLEAARAPLRKAV
jgi:hypothetical protein